MKNIVVLAHNRMKPALVTFLKDREDWLWGKTIVATGRSAEFLEKEQFKVPVRHLSPGVSGGYIEIREMIEQQQVDIVIFFRDHEVTQPHHEDIKALLEACNVNNIPLATNPASAELLIIGWLRKEFAEKNKDLET